MDQLGLQQSSVNEAYLQERLISRAIYLFIHQMQNAHGFFQSPSFTRHLTTFFTQVSILRHHKGFQFRLVTAYLVKVQRLSNYRMNKLEKTTKKGDDRPAPFLTTMILVFFSSTKKQLCIIKQSCINELHFCLKE